ncbi:hypothetical protein BH20ACI4_BH20ACI4_22780 [soil metagenome]
MNSEELEKSLRTEFENHLKSVLAGMRQELDGFQEKFTTEIENHKAHLGDVLQEFSARLDADNELDAGFKETVVEHLRLARDEGARITAEAITEAEQMEKESAPAVSFNELRDAVSEISRQGSQAEVLKSLVNHAAQYVPRGAFFIVKNEHFVGWRVFGREGEMDDQAVREVYFPISASTVLGESVRSLATVESSYGTYDDDAAYLEKLEFGQPDRMYALPLIARGRGVAVLYADYGHEGTSINIEALETLMRVAGLTVELLAASRGAKSRSEESDQMQETAQAEESQTAEYSEPQAEPQSFASVPAVEEQEAEEEYRAEEDKQTYEYPTEDQPSQSSDDYRFESKKSDEFEYQTPEAVESSDEEQTEAVEAVYQPAAEEPESFTGQDYSYSQEYQAEEPAEEEIAGQTEYSIPQYEYSEPAPEAETEEESTPKYSEGELQPVSEEPAWNQPSETNGYSREHLMEDASAEETPPYESTVSQSDFHIPATSGYDFESRSEETETAPAEESSEAKTPVMEDYSPAETTSDSFDSYKPQMEAKEPAYADPVETVSQSVISQPVRTRFSERNVDLPIEVEEDERRLHNDARRFARLLVSEIKLYNEQKVSEGRTSYNLYERLREAIDRSREMYDKRVQPPVAAKFDYFHYELINSLAEGDESRLGGSYPGANV